MGTPLRARISTLLGTAAVCFLALASACPQDLQDTRFEVQVYATGTGTGTVTAASGRIACDASAGVTQGDCSEHYVNEAGHHLYTASPASGSVFVDWVYPGGGANACADPTSPVCDVLWAVGSPDTVILHAHFATAGIVERRLVVLIRSDTLPARKKVVTSGDGRIHCRDSAGPADLCTAWYQPGAIVTLHAGDTGPGAFPLLGWNECVPDPLNLANCSVSLTEDRQVVAYFAPGGTMRLIAAGAGAGTITSLPAGISCSLAAGVATGACFTGFYDETYADYVRLTATPAAGSAFVDLTAVYNGVPTQCSGSPCFMIPVHDGTAVTATFSLVPGFALAVSFAGTGSGTVTSSPAGINCANVSGGGSTACTATYAGGTNVTLTAAPGGGSTFTGWSGSGCTGTAACTVAMDQARSVTATFASTTYLLTIRQAFSLTGTGTGVVTSSPTGISCTFTTLQSVPGGTCAVAFPAGTVVTLTAGVTLPSTFVSWIATAGCAANPVCQVTMDQDRTVDVSINP